MDSSRSVRRISVILTFWGGIVALLGAAVFSLVSSPVSPGAVLGIALILLAVNIFLSGELSPGFKSRTYTIKGQLVRGFLKADTGWNDLKVGACANDRVAQVLYGPFGAPDFTLEGGEAYLLLGKQSRLNLSSWETYLAPNLLWQLDLASSGGHFTLDLDSLRVSNLSVRSASGDISLTGSPRVFAEINLSSFRGDITLHIPPDLGVDIHLEVGENARVQIKNQRLKPISLNRYAIPEREARMLVKIQNEQGRVLLV